MKYIVLLFLSLFVFGCSSDGNSEATPCRILKYQKIYYNNAEYYKTEFVYENDRITKRLTKDYFNTFLTFEDSICYDSANRVTKIYYDINNPSLQTYTEHDLFYYNGNSNNAYKRERYRHYTDSGDEYKWIEDISYDTSNRILKTVNTFTYPPEDGLDPDTIVKDFTYDTNGNLIKTIEVNDTQYYIQTTTTNCSNYDSHKNPFRHVKVPFVDIRELQYSINNTQNKEVITEYGNNIPSVSTLTTTYEYNEFDYPRIAEYLCN
jgi:hypothetical protein